MRIFEDGKYRNMTNAEIKALEAEAAEAAHTDAERIASLEAENETLKAQVESVSEMMDFYEGCIAEMAEIVYA